MKSLDKWLFYIALGLVLYMPLHVFIVQSASLLTGGIDIWKAAKDVFIVLLVPPLLYISYKRGLFSDKFFRLFIILGGAYTLIHGLFVLFDRNNDLYSAIVGSVFNTRLLGIFLLGYILGAAKDGKKYLKLLVTASVLIAFIVATFGVMQYFLPPELLENVGYTLERGVKPLFFIDDNPDLPRVMSTLKDPNSLGAYLILPILFTGLALLKSKTQKYLFIREFRKSALIIMFTTMLVALFFTFSRGAAIGLIISGTVLLYLENTKLVHTLLRKYWWMLLILLITLVGGVYTGRNTDFAQDYIFHAAEREEVEDPNEKRVSLTQDAVEAVIDKPLGYGPGTAGLISISNPNGGLLMENYYLQIFYEVGWIGGLLFIGILGALTVKLQKICNLRYGESSVGRVLLVALAAYLFYSLFIHLWSNEAVALQWWLLAGVIIGLAPKSKSF